jgi:hypothetical protein
LTLRRHRVTLFIEHAIGGRTVDAGLDSRRLHG